ncbi:MAG: hypothetical protein O3A46_15980 [Candidatus Poribacteria bacterium]|nr:hypothetical protein [Candidatus Poribacteria bacterium]
MRERNNPTVESTPTGNITFDGDHITSLLLVEGDDEKRFFDRFLESLPTLRHIQVYPYGGKDRLRRELRMIRNNANFRRNITSLGIMRDADDNAENAFRAVCGSLDTASLPIPTAPMTRKDENGKPSVTVFITPDNRRGGMLETLCFEAVADSAVVACVNEFLRCLERSDRSLANPDKTRIYAYLSTTEEPGRRFGQALSDIVFPLDSVSFNGVREFLHSL